MWGKKKQKEKSFLIRLKDYADLGLKVQTIMKGRVDAFEGFISVIGKDFFEIADRKNIFVSIKFEELSAIIALWEKKEDRKIDNQRESQIKQDYVSLREIDY